MVRRKRRLPTQEELTIKMVGPISDLTITPKPLTIIIGEQASGKSLVAQLLYFFRNLKTLMSRVYSPEIRNEENWQRKTIRDLLDDLRGVPFGYFANGTAKLNYRVNRIDWKISIYSSNRNARPNNNLDLQMDEWVDKWSEDKSELGKAWTDNQIYIPTERSVFTRLWGQAQSVLFAGHQPQPLRHFAEYLSKAYPIYQKLHHARSSLGKELKFKGGEEQLVDFILSCQKNALDGEAYVPRHGPQVWKWKIEKENDKSKIIPIEAIASGQMEAWPFFVIAATFGIFVNKADIYFEEPETHLHPKAQLEIMRAIGYLVNKGQRFVITTHSPYLLYAVNNMIQRYITYEGQIPEGEDVALAPDKVIAYRLGPSPEKISDDAETGLLNLNELEHVADELGGEFDCLLDKMDDSR